MFLISLNIKCLFIGVFCIILNTFAQKDSIKNYFSLSLSAYLETYYAYDFNNPADHNRPHFIYSYHRHNEVNLNLGFIKTEYTAPYSRANFALMTGTYSQANLASEPGMAKNIFEANAGIKLSKQKNIWIDIGIFPSHIGFESAIGKDCWNVTRSILADNSPYYESGIKLSYKNKNEKWLLNVLYLNGWQRIYRIAYHTKPAFGHQISYKPNSNILLNSSSFIGSVLPDSLNQTRYFHNFYSQFQVTDKIGIITGFDIGVQQKSKNSREYNVWYAPVLITQYKFSDKISCALRGEYYYDRSQIIITTNTPNGFQTYGYSLNVDYQLTKNVLWRIEGRQFISKDKIFMLDKQPSAYNYFIIMSISAALYK